MAARLNPRHTELVRQKIQASNLIARLHKCVEGEVEMTAVQLGAAVALLDRSVPKLSQQQIVGADGGPLQAVIRWSNSKT